MLTNAHQCLLISINSQIIPNNTQNLYTAMPSMIYPSYIQVILLETRIFYVIYFDCRFIKEFLRQENNMKKLIDVFNIELYT